ncbi:Bacterial ribonuclease P protein component [Prochlorococcus marinus str. MIT 9515]|uniref:Ribonuclease P protein component n=1 Tax=Prochlorococcus marinus (strain MIT 9515) TaxID=167542 RepID=RNPA_PROM5|nr:ribonuclease P protein component [Prochlorococcus marinus]A2BXQ2.1 RecName: Full=Ribonuclease P protein component; Short=RNase P protein; Short=RNaseP protein; AltName: Full=Protein C5 [Prochlorococcus marinus str. MIT 9515]ABM72563.1 Bacterial ribonuclease P protein component [Prochlorococcus marinus str. MIT 9515]
MALPKAMRLKGHRTFDYIHKNSEKYYGKLMTFKIARSNPKILISHKNFNSLNNFKIAIAISKKVSKKAVVRNKIRRLLQDYFLKNFRKDKNHKPYWLLVNLKSSDSCNYESKLLQEFQHLIFKSGLLND